MGRSEREEELQDGFGPPRHGLPRQEPFFFPALVVLPRAPLPGLSLCPGARSLLVSQLLRLTASCLWALVSGGGGRRRAVELPEEGRSPGIPRGREGLLQRGAGDDHGGHPGGVQRGHLVGDPPHLPGRPLRPPGGGRSGREVQEEVRPAWGQVHGDSKPQVRRDRAAYQEEGGLRKGRQEEVIKEGGRLVCLLWFLRFALTEFDVQLTCSFILPLCLLVLAFVFFKVRVNRNRSSQPCAICLLNQQHCKLDF